jgi:hypothetical protein
MEGYGSDSRTATEVGHGYVTAAMSGALTAKAVEPTPPLQSEVRNLERSIHRLDQLLSQLAGRIEPVCREVPPSPVTNGAEARARANSGLGSQLGAYADQIDGLSARISGLLHRCEL